MERLSGSLFFPGNIRLNEDVFSLRLQKTSWRRLDQDEYVRLTHTSLDDVFKTSSSRSTYSSWSYVFKTSSRRFQDDFKTSSRHLQDVFKIFWERLQDVLSSYTVLGNTISKRLLTRLSTEGLPMSHFWEIYGQYTKFTTMIKISQVLIFHFTTPFSGYTLQRRI